VRQSTGAPATKLLRLDESQAEAVDAVLRGSGAQMRESTWLVDETGVSQSYAQHPGTVADKIATASDQAAVIDAVFGATPIATQPAIGAVGGASAYSVYAGVPALARAGEQRRSTEQAERRAKLVRDALPADDSKALL